MSKLAWAYLNSILLFGMLLTVSAVLSFQPASLSWLLFGLLTGMTILAQIFKSETPNHQTCHLALIFLFAGVVLLPPLPFVFLVLVSHLVVWAYERLWVKGSRLSAWYIQPFNMAVHILVGLTAQAIHTRVLALPRMPFGLAPVSAALLGAVVYTVLDHLLMGQMIVLARKVNWRQSGILNLENLLVDLVLLVMGSVLALALRVNPPFILAVLSPVYLIHRALSVPTLKRQANSDAKTGLWNARYFIESLETELSRSQRFGRPLTIVMADLDLLRNINNTFGHLAGDAVLIGVARILKDSLREYDLVARFGGEEFAVLLPEVCPEEAYWRVEAIRQAVEAADFKSPVNGATIKATMSFGLAGLDGVRTARDVIHSADVAVYQAKMQGRNRTFIYSQQEACELGIFQVSRE